MNASLTETFAPIRGKFSDDAMIFLTSCNFAGNSATQAERLGETFREVLGIRSATVFLFKKASYISKLEARPFWTIPNRGDMIENAYFQIATGAVVAFTVHMIAQDQIVTATIPADLLAAFATTYAVVFNRGFRIDLAPSVPAVTEMHRRTYLREYFRPTTCAAAL